MSSFAITDGSVHGFSGLLEADTTSHFTTFYTSTAAFRFSLDQEYSYSISADIANYEGGANSEYFFESSGQFRETADINRTQVLNFSKSGVLAPGDYRFELSLQAHQVDSLIPIGNTIVSHFDFNLTPVPEGPFPLWPVTFLVTALLLWSKHERG